MTQVQRRNSKTKKNDTMSLLHDWREALRKPHVYRVGRGSLRIQNQFLIIFSIILLLPILYYTYPTILDTVCPVKQQASSCFAYYKYDDTYPLTKSTKTALGITYKISLISDLDTDSKVNDKNKWISYVKEGSLTWQPQSNKISIYWENNNDYELSSTLAMKGRGMELSELVTFNGKLLSFDDRTGLVYYIENKTAYPWIILMDGDGKKTKGFKSEWATVKDNLLYVGSMGKEWTTSDGIFNHHDPMWVKVISPRGEVQSLNWIDNYKKLRQAIGIEFPGYMIHESGEWSNVLKKWIFLPRRCSKEQYNETKDEVMSCNVLLTADDDFSNVKVTTINNSQGVRGFSSFKFLPGSDDKIIIALKSEEFQGNTKTYITAFTIDGTILMNDVKIADQKFEGIEFV